MIFLKICILQHFLINRAICQQKHMANILGKQYIALYDYTNLTLLAS
jgi:hypothetical protein